jgi:predicted cupin superfamily sugar epimerase
VTPVHGTTDTVSITAYLAAPGYLHYSVVRAGSPEPSGAEIKDAKVGGSVAAMGTAEVLKPGRTTRTVGGLDPTLAYDMFFVAEGKSSNGVFGAVHATKDVRTHSPVPDLVHFSAVPKNASSSSATVSFEAAPGIYATTTLHYVVVLAGKLSPSVGKELKTLSLSKHPAVVARGKLEPKTERQEHAIAGLHPGKRYHVFAVCERTGVFNRVANSTLATHGLPPRLLATPRVWARNGSVSVFHFGCRLSQRGWLHYVVTTGNSLPEAVLASADQLVAAPVGGPVVAAGKLWVEAEAEAGAGGGLGATHAVSGLQPGARYGLYLVTETAQSFGVFGKVSAKLEALTHRQAPALSDTSASATDGSTTSLTLGYQLSEEGVLHFAVLPAGSEGPTSGSHLAAMACRAVSSSADDSASDTGGGGSAHGLAGGSGRAPSRSSVCRAKGRVRFTDQDALRELPVTTVIGQLADTAVTALTAALRSGASGLEAGTAYDVYLATETAQSFGVFGPVSGRLEVQTHRQAPALAHIEAAPSNGSTTSLALGYQLSRTGLVHYIVVAAGAMAPASGQALLALAAADAGASLAHGRSRAPCTVGSATVEVELSLSGGGGGGGGGGRCGGDGGGGGQCALDVYFVAEAAGSNGVFGAVSAAVPVATHGRAPTLSAESARPVAGTTGTIRVGATLDREGVLHYVVQVRGSSR